MSVSTWIASLRPVDLMSGAAALNPDASTSWTPTQPHDLARADDPRVRVAVG